MEEKREGRNISVRIWAGYSAHASSLLLWFIFVLFLSAIFFWRQRNPEMNILTDFLPRNKNCLLSRTFWWLFFQYRPKWKRKRTGAVKLQNYIKHRKRDPSGSCSIPKSSEAIQYILWQVENWVIIYWKILIFTIALFGRFIHKRSCNNVRFVNNFLMNQNNLLTNLFWSMLF